MTGLTDLPSELISAIVSFLDDSDVSSTRLTCRLVERASLAHCGHRWFRKKGFMVTTPSLKVLASIAAHDDFKKYVQHVWFNPDCFTFVRPDCAPDAQEAPDPENPDSILQLLSPGDRKRYEAYQAVMRDHTLLLSLAGAQLQDVLTPIFASLPNLKIIGMRRSEDHAPWGWRGLKEAVGEDPRELGEIPSGLMHSLSEPTRLFTAIVNAVAATDVKLRRFYTDAIELDNVDPQLLTQETLNKACGPVWYLEVNITKGRVYQKPGTGAIQLVKLEDYGHGLIRLLKSTRELKEIGLQLFPDRQQSHKLAPNWEDPESWRTSYPYLVLQNLVESVRLLYLERVKLEKVATSPVTLLGFLIPCSERLTSLKLRDVRLLSDEQNPKPWRTVFAFLLTSCPNLDYLLFYHLLYDRGGISFVQEPPMPLPEATGSLMGAADSGSFFVKYEHIALQVSGQEEVRKKLKDVVEGHWYQMPVSSYQMDEEAWHTDTSDEEW